jgi:hypothetical protein
MHPYGHIVCPCGSGKHKALSCATPAILDVPSHSASAWKIVRAMRQCSRSECPCWKANVVTPLFFNSTPQAETQLLRMKVNPWLLLRTYFPPQEERHIQSHGMTWHDIEKNTQILNENHFRWDVCIHNVCPAKFPPTLSHLPRVQSSWSALSNKVSRMSASMHAPITICMHGEIWYHHNISRIVPKKTYE